MVRTLDRGLIARAFHLTVGSRCEDNVTGCRRVLNFAASLRNLCALCVSAVSFSAAEIHRRGAENAEVAQSKPNEDTTIASDSLTRTDNGVIIRPCFAGGSSMS